MKKCIKCGVEKDITAFHKCANKRDGHDGRCKACVRKVCREWYLTNMSRAKATSRRWREDNQLRRAFMSSLFLALKRGPTPNPITVDGLIKLFEDQGGRCALSGIPMTFGGGRRGGPLPTSCSMDRIEPAKGYAVGNVRLICYAVNSFRGPFSDDQMYEMLKTFYEYAFKINKKVAA